MFLLSLLPLVNMTVCSRGMGQHEQMVGPQLLPSEFSLLQAGDFLLIIFSQWAVHFFSGSTKHLELCW